MTVHLSSQRITILIPYNSHPTGQIWYEPTKLVPANNKIAKQQTY